MLQIFPMYTWKNMFEIFEKKITNCTFKSFQHFEMQMAEIHLLMEKPSLGLFFLLVIRVARVARKDPLHSVE